MSFERAIKQRRREIKLDNDESQQKYDINWDTIRIISTSDIITIIIIIIFIIIIINTMIVVIIIISTNVKK